LPLDQSYPVLPTHYMLRDQSAIGAYSFALSAVVCRQRLQNIRLDTTGPGSALGSTNLEFSRMSSRSKNLVVRRCTSGVPRQDPRCHDNNLSVVNRLYDAESILICPIHVLQKTPFISTFFCVMFFLTVDDWARRVSPAKMATRAAYLIAVIGRRLHHNIAFVLIDVGQIFLIYIAQAPAEALAKYYLCGEG